MRTVDEKVKITIDNNPYTFQAGMTILKAAEQAGIYIPTLCAHKELSPHGGCRICIVEVDGFRNFPTACTTPISEGMVIRTNTAALNAIRYEIIQLFMSEHTSSCLICPESDECRQWMGTVRKAGVTTGCRYCPNDGQCEFQDVVEKMGIKEIKYPIYYRNNRIEKEDPFYDRNYNLCVLCGRCVRMCQEIRAANVLAFKYRGRETVIGPSFGRTHVDAGCEFCGACVSVCPTGALSEKDRKWEGKPDREEITTCSFCGVGCQMRLQVKDNRIIGSLPVVGDEVNNGQLCVRGRFCISEVVNGHQRLQHPRRNENNIGTDMSWDDVISLAAKKLAACKPNEVGFLISPNCTNEDLYIAQKFARVVMGSNNIETSARSFYGSGFNAYIDLLGNAVPLADVRKADVIFCAGLDARFGRSVVGVEIRKAAIQGAKILTVHPRSHSFDLIADKWFKPLPHETLSTFEKLVKLTKLKSIKKSKEYPEDLIEIAEYLQNAEAPIILIGSEFLQYTDSEKILTLIKELGQKTNAGIVPLPAQNNLVGSLKMGAYPEILPGGVQINNVKRAAELKKLWGFKIPQYQRSKNKQLFGGKKLRVLYLIGEIPLNGELPEADFIISQNLYAADDQWGVDLDLPAAAFTESDGTFVNGEGRLQRVQKAVAPKGQALPDWEILSRLAQKMGVSGFKYKNANDVFKEISSIVPEFKNFNRLSRKPEPITFKASMETERFKPTKELKIKSNGSLILSACAVEHTHRGMTLSTWVDGSRVIFREGVIDINPVDADKIKVNDGDEVTVVSDNLKSDWTVRLEQKQPQGTLFMILPQGEYLNSNPQSVELRRKNV